MFKFSLPTIKARILQGLTTLIVFAILETFNHEILTPFLEGLNKPTENQMLLEFLINNLSLIILVALVITLGGMLLKWRRDDNALKRNNFIDIIKDLHHHQSKLSWYTQNEDKTWQIIMQAKLTSC